MEIIEIMRVLAIVLVALSMIAVVLALGGALAAPSPVMWGN